MHARMFVYICTGTGRATTGVVLAAALLQRQAVRVHVRAAARYAACLLQRNGSAAHGRSTRSQGRWPITCRSWIAGAGPQSRAPCHAAAATHADMHVFLVVAERSVRPASGGLAWAAFAAGCMHACTRTSRAPCCAAPGSAPSLPGRALRGGRAVGPRPGSGRAPAAQGGGGQVALAAS